MKKKPYALFLLLLATLALGGCKKDYPNLQVVPTTSIVFEGAVDKITGDYKLGSTLTISVPNATSVNVVSNYTTGTVRTVTLASLPVSGGVVTIPVNNLRAAADGTPIGASTVTPTPTGASRAANTYTLTVDATDGTNSFRRFYTVVLTQ